MAKSLTNHFAVKEKIHRAAKSVASEEGIELNDLVERVLLTDKRIKKAHARIKD